MLSRLLERLILGAIKTYQKTLSPDHGFLKVLFPGGFCKYRPSCSDYAALAITKHGIFKGFSKAGWRVLRCNPWSEGGLDLP